MNQTETRSTRDLFRAWRSGDAMAGQEMAQRFADWYYAIATSRMGEHKGRAPCEVACARFGAGIVEVTEARALVDWAYDIIKDELAKAGKRLEDGNEPNAYTGNQRPKVVLARARTALPEEVRLLEGVYSGKLSDGEAEELARPLGGMPIGVLKGRYRVKQWLRDNCGVPFEVAPDNPVLDRAPMPLYESGRMGSPAEEAGFEKWMLSDLDLCKDIAEFAHFAIALRGGLPENVPQTIPAPPTLEEIEKTEPMVPRRSPLRLLAALAVVFVGFLVLAALAAIVYFVVL